MKEEVIIGGMDFSDTDAEARAIIDFLADKGLKEETRLPSFRVLMNMILKAQKELREPQTAH